MEWSVVLERKSNAVEWSVILEREVKCCRIMVCNIREGSQML